MKFRKLTFKQDMTFWIIFDGASAIGNAVNRSYIWTGVWIAFGIIMIYFREKYGDIL